MQGDALGRAAAALALLTAGWGAAADKASSPCEARLERSLVEMERRPLLKEEHATALMWLRLDAAEALREGDEVTCAGRLDAVELLLGMTAGERAGN